MVNPPLCTFRDGGGPASTNPSSCTSSPELRRPAPTRLISDDRFRTRGHGLFLGLAIDSMAAAAPARQRIVGNRATASFRMRRRTIPNPCIPFGISRGPQGPQSIGDDETPAGTGEAIESDLVHSLRNIEGPAGTLLVATTRPRQAGRTIPTSYTLVGVSGSPQGPADQR